MAFSLSLPSWRGRGCIQIIKSEDLRTSSRFRTQWFRMWSYKLLNLEDVLGYRSQVWWMLVWSYQIRKTLNGSVLSEERHGVCYRAIQRAQQFPGGRGLSRQVSIALQEVIQMKATRDGNAAVTWPGQWWGIHKRSLSWLHQFCPAPPSWLATEVALPNAAAFRGSLSALAWKSREDPKPTLQDWSLDWSVEKDVGWWGGQPSHKEL